MIRNIIDEVRPLLNNFEHFEVFVVKREVNMENHTVVRHAQFVTNLLVWMDEALSNNNLSLMQLQQNICFLQEKKGKISYLIICEGFGLAF